MNFADTYHRGGISHPWPVPPCPVVIGFEGVGIVEGTGVGVTGFKTGDWVAYGIPPLGSYSEIRNYPVDKLLHLPANLDERQVAALLMKGMTVHYLLHRTYPVKPGDTIVVHAAAEYRKYKSPDFSISTCEIRSSIYPLHCYLLHSLINSSTSRT